MKKKSAHAVTCISDADVSAQALKRYTHDEIENLLSGAYGDFLYTVLCSAASQAGLSDRRCREGILHAAEVLSADDFRIVRRYRDGCSFKGYLAAVCIDIISDVAARQTGKDDPAGRDMLIDDAGLRLTVKANRGIFEQARAALDEGLSALPAEERIALRMRFEQKMSYGDINTLLGIKNAEKKVRAAYVKLKRSIEKRVEGIRGLIP